MLSPTARKPPEIVSFRHHSSFCLDCVNKALEPLAFSVEHLTAERGEPVVAAAGVVELGPRTLARLLNQLRLDHAFQGAVKRRRPKADLTHGAPEDFLHDAVPMLFFTGKGEQDVKPLGF